MVSVHSRVWTVMRWSSWSLNGGWNLEGRNQGSMKLASAPESMKTRAGVLEDWTVRIAGVRERGGEWRGAMAQQRPP